MMPTHEIQLNSLRLGGNNPLFLIAGPCVIESESHARSMAERVAKIAADAQVPYIFKASYDKANRSSVKSFRGPGLIEGLRILNKIKSELKLPILTDIHDAQQAAPAAEVCDILQIPAFLSRQTDLLLAAAKTGRIVNVKKAQFVSPWDMTNVAGKIASTGNNKIILTERGASFGYQNLVVDMRSFPILKRLGYPVVFDVTHSVQLPGGQGHASGGQPEFIEPLARAGVAAGVDNPCAARATQRTLATGAPLERRMTPAIPDSRRHQNLVILRLPDEGGRRTSTSGSCHPDSQPLPGTSHQSRVTTS